MIIRNESEIDSANAVLYVASEAASKPNFRLLVVHGNRRDGMSMPSSEN